MPANAFRRLPTFVLAIAALIALAPPPISAQSGIQTSDTAASSLVTTRITQPIDDSSLVTLKGTVHPLANARNDRGAAPDSMQLDRMHLVLKRNAAQDAALKQLIGDLHTPGSASYHKWLTPDAFGKQFGPSDQDIASVESWLQANGFSVTKVNAGRQTIEISGNVAQLRSAFHTQIHKYLVNGETHYANATDPKIPAALAPVVGGFVSLNNFRPKSYARVLGKAQYDTQTHTAKPEWTYGNSSGVNFPLAPADYAIQYDLSPLYTAGVNGTGQTIAIINDSNINIYLVNQFRSLFGLSANPPQVIIDGNDPGVDGINNPDGPNFDSSEAYLDVEWSGAVAPNATIDLVIGADTALEAGLYLAAEHAVSGNIAPVMSISFGTCEAAMGSTNQFLSNLWEQAAAQGITVLVATGDAGSASCDNDNTQYYAVNGQAVSGFASTPYNVAVGGTDFYYSSWNQGSSAINNQLATYWNTSPSQNPQASLLSVIPEQPWNDSQYGLNVTNIYTESGNTQTSIAGGGGGASSAAVCSNNTFDSNGNCTGTVSGYPKPSWQQGTGVPADNVRDLPDVSLFASDNMNYSYYPLCASDGDCQPASGSNLVQISGVGGTSASSPSFAGIMALVNQKYGAQGQADFVLYPLKAQFPAAFHDVTNGTNSVPCAFSPSTPNCIAVTNPITVTDPNLGTATEGQIGSGTTPSYNAAAGYNLATGLGTIDANQLVTSWGNIKFNSTSVTLTPSSTSFMHGTSITISGSVTTPNGTPTGDVALMTDSTEGGQQGQGLATLLNGNKSVFPLSNGSFSSSVNYLPGGIYNIWGQYGGDSSNNLSTSQKTQITVSPENSSIYFNLFSPGGTIPSGTANIDYGTQILLSAQVVPSSQLTAVQNCQTGTSACPTFTSPTGTVAFADGATPINTAAINAEGDAEYNAPFALGSHSVTASYAGDNSYNKSTASAVTFTVVKDTPQINLSAANQTSNGQYITGQTTAFNIQVANGATVSSANPNQSIVFPSHVAPPTGTVTVSGFPSGVPTSGTLTAAVDPAYQAVEGVVTLSAPASTPSGNYNVTINYSGDANYNPTSASGQIQIVSNSGGLASSTTATVSGTISPATSITVTGTVTGQSGHAAPTGGILVYSSGYIATEIPIVPGSGDSSTFSFALNSQTLFQGANFVTLQYTGDNNYYSSAYQLASPVSSPLSDFSMVPIGYIVGLPAGGSGSDLIDLTSVNGFAGTVTFTCTVPSGINCANISPVTLTSGGTTSFNVNLTAPTSTINGTYNVLITGTDSTGEFVHTLSLEAVVTGNAAAAPALNLTNSGSISVAAGSSGSSSITVTPQGGFTGAVNLSCAITTSPSGATSPPTCNFGHGLLNIGSAGALTANLIASTTTSTTTGNYIVTVTGTDVATGKITATTPVSLVVMAPPAMNFKLASSPATLSITPGATSGNTSTISVSPSGGFTGTVSLSCTVAGPSGANDPATCSLPGSVSVTAGSTPTATLTITTTAATSGALERPLNKFFALGGGIAVAGLLFFGIPARRRSWCTILGVVFFAAIVGLGIGCGGSSSSGGGGGGGGNAGTSPGNYVVTVTGTNGSLSPTTTVTVTVN